MRLLERESQLEALAQYAREAGAGQGRLVLVSGEAGVGKSSLLERTAWTGPSTRGMAG
jgi:predicted ATPase